jgi:hypothetical protein
MNEAAQGLSEYLQFYNEQSLHAALAYRNSEHAYSQQYAPSLITVGKNALKKAA